MNDLVKALSLGLSVCFCLVVPVVLGVLADKMFHTEPLWIIVGTIIGLCSALWTLKELVK